MDLKNIWPEYSYHSYIYQNQFYKYHMISTNIYTLVVTIYNKTKLNGLNIHIWE